jgi:hypothetical protein
VNQLEFIRRRKPITVFLLICEICAICGLSFSGLILAYISFLAAEQMAERLE